MPDPGSMERVTLWRWTGGGFPPGPWESGPPWAGENDDEQEVVEFVPLAELERLREALEDGVALAEEFDGVVEGLLARRRVTNVPHTTEHSKSFQVRARSALAPVRPEEDK